MPVKIRLERRGRKKQAMYDVVIADSRAPRDGKFIEKVTNHNSSYEQITGFSFILPVVNCLEGVKFFLLTVFME